MIWSENEVEQFTFELANTDISSLLDEIQMMEDAVAEVALFPEFCSGLLIPDTDLGENPRRERGV
ncbi:TPA: hypothetical protein SMR28_005936 [Pseudomonas aeruginosa]|nr:hypothetical protein [Pseudomonas aeruginosa]HCL3197148.1 hypothetical protein [Pseudomonas aeruginosa]HEK1628184.1 hypothetical protein [Pseudomonas aeruginosa]